MIASDDEVVRASRRDDTADTAAVRASVMNRPSSSASSAPVSGSSRTMEARCDGRPREEFAPKTVTSFAPSAARGRSAARAADECRHRSKERVVTAHRNHRADGLGDLSRRKAFERGRHGLDEIVHVEDSGDIGLGQQAEADGHQVAPMTDGARTARTQRSSAATRCRLVDRAPGRRPRRPRESYSCGSRRWP